VKIDEKQVWLALNGMYDVGVPQFLGERLGHRKRQLYPNVLVGNL